MKRFFQVLIMGLLMGGLQPVMAQIAKVVNSDYSDATYTFTFGKVNLQSQIYGGQVYESVTLDGSAPSELLGKPALPIVTKMIEIPLCGSVSVKVSDVQSITLQSLKNRMLPVQPAPSKSDLGQRPFVIDSAAYAVDEYYSQPEAWVEVVGVARDRNLAMLRLSPLSYNPVTGEMELIKQMTVKVTFNDADVAGTEAMRAKYYSPDFALGTELLSTLPAGKDIHKTAPLHYLIVAHSMFRGKLDEYIDWKKRQGFIVTVGYTDDAAVGTTSNSIAEYTKSFYTNATAELPAPTYLLLVGDHQQIPAFNARCTSPASDHVTDLYYVSWTSGDNTPDCYVGRFSARNDGELTPQIEKTIYYERYDFARSVLGYLGKGILIAGEDSGRSGDNAYTYADPAMDYIAKTYVNAGNGYTDVRYYKNNVNFAPDGVTVNGNCSATATATTLRSLYSQGYGWINYSAHGYDDEWSTPKFTASHVGAMNNNNCPSIMIGNCCLSGKFNTTGYDACLGEALLRRGNKAGAVAYIGGTNSTYWPQDFCWAVGVRSSISNTMNTNYNSSNLGCYDRLFHTHDELYTYWHNTMGAVVFAGNTAAQTYSSNYGLYYWEIYELFGDPSLMPWLGVPEEMDVAADDVIPLGTTEYSVTAVPRAYVALTTAEGHEFVAAAYADHHSGEATLRLPSDLDPGDYELAIWAQGYKPVFKPVTITVLNGPYLQIREVLSSTGCVVPGDYNDFDFVIANLGNRTASYGYGVVTLEDHTVGCLGNEFSTGNISANAIDTLRGALRLFVPADKQDGDVIRVTLSLRFDGGQSARTVGLTVTAPNLVYTETRATPALEGGVRSMISMRITNSGSVASDNMTLQLRHNYGLVAEFPEAFELGSLTPGATRTVTFYVTMVESLPTGAIPFDLIAHTAEGEILVNTLRFQSGLVDVENFESGMLGNSVWQNGSNPWEFTSAEAHEGTACLRSKNGLRDNASSQITATWTGVIDDSIRFWYKVSSEQSYDKFTFVLDGTQKLEASGEVEWTRVAYPVSAGTHTFVFKYTKDRNQTNGRDCAYIDDIVFPNTATGVRFVADTVCQNQPYTFDGQIIATAEEGSSHYISADGDTLLALTVAPAPHVTIEASGDIIRGDAVVLVAHGASRYEWNTGATGSVLVDYPENNTTYTVTGYTGSCSDQATYSIVVGIDKAEGRIPVSLYPNPAKQLVVVAAEGMRVVSVINQLGQVVIRKEIASSCLQLDIKDLPTGVYFVKVEMLDSVVMTRLLKK